MRRPLRLTALAGTIVLAACTLHGCTSLRRVSPEEFERALGRGPETAHVFTPIGVAGDRAYLEHWSMLPLLGERRTVMWTPVAELSPEVAARVRKGK